MTRISEIPQDLLAAFWRYERALMDNNVDELDTLFAAGPHTIRSDSGVTLAGHAAIGAFRAGRPKPPQRWLEQVFVSLTSPTSATIVAQSRRRDGGRGAQTQVWVLGESGWQVQTAHVSLAGPEPVLPVDPHDPRIWRATAQQSAQEGQAFPPPTPGPLTGLSFAVKDLFAVAGHKVGGGNPTWLAHSATYAENSAAVAALLGAGASITGIAHTDELAFSLAGTNIHYGTPPNAAAPGHITGGSTSGPSAAVAAGLADIGLGTDTAGSIRVPASYCGLYGLRTTHGAISKDGLVGLAESFDTVGVVSRSAQVLALANKELLAGDPFQSTVPVREIVVAPTLIQMLAPDVREAFESGVLALALRLGLPVRELTESESFTTQELDTWFTAFRTVQSAEGWREHGTFVEQPDSHLDPAVAQRFRNGQTVTPETEAAGRSILAQATARITACLPAGTVLALPSAASGAPHAQASPQDLEASRNATLKLTCLSSLTGLPALGAPLLKLGTLPLGLCLIAAPHHDSTLLGLITDPRFAPSSVSDVRPTAARNAGHGNPASGEGEKPLEATESSKIQETR